MDSAAPFGDLTPIQVTICTEIRKLTVEHGHPPSMREVAAAVGRKSAGGLSHQYEALEAKGWLRRDARRPRTVEVRLPGESGFPSDGGGPGQVPGPGPEAAGTSAGTGRETMVWVPVKARVAAGVPILPSEGGEDGFSLPREVVGEGTLFMLKVVGDSMIGVGIFGGDWVVVREQREAENGEIVAALVDGMEVEGTVKTLKLLGGHRWLMPQNPAYTPISGDEAEISGKVVAVLRRV